MKRGEIYFVHSERPGTLTGRRPVAGGKRGFEQGNGGRATRFSVQRLPRKGFKKKRGTIKRRSTTSTVKGKQSRKKPPGPNLYVLRVKWQRNSQALQDGGALGQRGGEKRNDGLQEEEPSWGGGFKTRSAGGRSTTNVNQLGE